MIKDLQQFDSFATGVLDLLEPDVTVPLAEVTRHTQGLKGRGACYWLTDNGQIVYTGVTSDVAQRLHRHKYQRTGVNTLRGKLLLRYGMSDAEAQMYLNSLQAHILFEEDIERQDVIEKLIIYRYSPEYHIDNKKRSGRPEVLDVPAVVELYEGGMTAKEIAIKIGFSEATIKAELRAVGAQGGQTKQAISL